MHRFGAAMLVLFLACGSGPAAARGFDYYVLALSWSPTYCASPEAKDDRAQCGEGRRYGFVAHGLWPQYEKGWPEFCETRERWVPEGLIDEMLPIMPSKRLVIHQWRKHGSCSGMSQSEYFDLTRALFAKIRIPARYVSPQAAISVSPKQLKHDFVETNAWLDRSMMAVDCGNRRERARLEEIRLCFSREGEPAACAANERQQCRAGTLQMPPVR